MSLASTIRSGRGGRLAMIATESYAPGWLDAISTGPSAGYLVGAADVHPLDELGQEPLHTGGHPRPANDRIGAADEPGEPGGRDA